MFLPSTFESKQNGKQVTPMLLMNDAYYKIIVLTIDNGFVKGQQKTRNILKCANEILHLITL